MPLASGTKLGPYEIVGAIGAGGMGEVYRARDTRLGREVAIKILPQHLASTPEVRQRFEREARAVSSLNHPHICTLHDVGHQDGTDFLVMEYLEGETLAKRLEKGPLPTAELLRTAIEIADALEKAHRQGVIHRDLKPGNIMLTKSGAKLVDFGLAKATGLAAPPSSSLTLSLNNPRATDPVTAKGTIVGTFQYMAPEQVEGKESDARSDIFSFGAMLFEMATGKRAFEGKSQASVIAAILEREPPPISQLQPMSPPQLDRVVKTCLAKDPDDRFQTAHDLKLQLEWMRDGGSQAGVPVPVVAHTKTRERIAWGTAALLAVIAAMAIIGYIERAPQPGPAIVSEISPPSNVNFMLAGLSAGTPALSPDGQRLAFSAVGSDAREPRLWVRQLNSATAQPLAGTNRAAFPFWSPDSRTIGFFANGQLERIDTSGGPPVVLCSVEEGRLSGTWGTDGTILFTQKTNGPIFRIPASGGTPQPVTKVNISLAETFHRWPRFLPDGKHFIYFAGPPNAQISGVYAASLDGSEPELLVRTSSNMVYVPPGYLLFIRQGALVAQRFDADRLRVVGDTALLAEDVGVDQTDGQGIFSASDNGILVYRTGSVEPGGSGLRWFDRNGKQIAQTGSPGIYGTSRISPDGSKLAVSTLQPNALWVYDIAHGTRRRITFSASVNGQASWSPDGKFIAFFSNRNGEYHLFQKAADGTGSTTPLFMDDATEQYPSWSPDGRYLIFERTAAQPNSRTEIWALPLFGERKAFPVVQAQSDVTWPAVSPDGKWLAYVSAETGQEEIYVESFLHGTGKWLVSSNGGTRPRWRGDGKELFYLSLDSKIIAAEISESASSVSVGQVQPLFPINLAPTAGWLYDVTADGKKFLVVSEEAEKSSAPLTLVTNWPALLKKQ